MKKRSKEVDVVDALVAELTAELEAARVGALQEYSRVSGKVSPSIQSLHGVIGGKNRDYADVVHTQFSSSGDFNARWLKELRAKADQDIEESSYVKSAERLIELLQNDCIRQYTLKFLERNFYRNLNSRVRGKPAERLWRLWIGANDMKWGLFIAPAIRGGAWSNDQSEIRRAKYDYWTVGHIMTTGIIDPDSDRLVSFSTLDDFLQFYRSVLKRCSRSLYEREIADRYVRYLEGSTDPDQEPLLIPELRYAGMEKDHRYRLDFTVLNPHVMSLTGFELSPSSSHMAVKGAKGKLQKELNRELSEKWSKEMRKRNDYYSEFGITTVTFTDVELDDIDSCFGVIAEHLSRRGDEPMNLDYQISELESWSR